jgi:hypothetical protein
LAGLTLGTNETKLASSGIDDISLSLTTEQQLVSLLQNGSANNLQIDQLQAANLGVDIDFGSGQVGIEALSVSATSQITLDANPETTGTHLSTSLKDLQKLGVDAVAISGMEDVTIDLGSESGFQLDADGKFLQFTGANGGPLASNVDITLQTTGLDQLLQASQLANTAGINLSDTGANAVGIDKLGIDLSNNATDLTTTNVASFGSALTTLRTEGLDLSILLDQQDATALTQLPGGFQFSAQDIVSLEITADSANTVGTHLSTSLKDLQKLGVDAVAIAGDLDGNAATLNSISLDLGTGAALSALNLPKFGDANKDGILSKQENDNLEVTLNLGATNLQDVASLAKALHDSGIDHLALNTSDFTPNQDLLSTLKWLESGLDLTLKVDNTAPMLAGKTANNLADIVDVLDGGLNLLSSTNLTPGETWGTLIQTLHDAGLGRIDIEKTASVHIHDELSAALYESGMLHALPQANVEIDAEGIKLLSTSLKAMADLGVDKVHTDAKVYLELGLRDAGLSDLTDLFAAFGLNTPSDPAHELFANQGASLVLDKDTADNIGLGNAGGVSSTVLDLMGKLSKLGITQIDVVDPTAHTVTHEYNIVAQTPVEVAVHTLGADLFAVTHVFDTDILHKPVKG